MQHIYHVASTQFIYYPRLTSIFFFFCGEYWVDVHRKFLIDQFLTLLIKDWESSINTRPLTLIYHIQKSDKRQNVLALTTDSQTLIETIAFNQLQLFALMKATISSNQSRCNLGKHPFPYQHQDLPSWQLLLSLLG